MTALEQGSNRNYDMDVGARVGLTDEPLLAEGVGFEPTNPGYGLAVFKTAAIDRSATPPVMRTKPGTTPTGRKPDLASAQALRKASTIWETRSCCSTWGTWAASGTISTREPAMRFANSSA